MVGRSCCVQKPSGPEAELSEADELAKDASKGKEAAAVYKRVYEALAKESQPSPLLQARCLAGLGTDAWAMPVRPDAARDGSMDDAWPAGWLAREGCLLRLCPLPVLDDASRRRGSRL